MSARAMHTSRSTVPGQALPLDLVWLVSWV